VVKRYRYHVSQSVLGQEGAVLWLNVGDCIDVNGEAMVREGNVITPASGWHDTEAEATQRAADTIELMARRFFTQAETLRAKAREVTAAPG
jgi:hypothetical protein